MIKRIGLLVTRTLQGLLDTIAAILGTYYAAKYAAIARRLGLPRPTPADKRRGFIIVQIDGLAYLHLNMALDLGYVPHLQRMLHTGQFTLGDWQSGLPCTTPAAQAGIMFGSNDDIPAFRWYDKAASTSIVCKLPRDIQDIQERVAYGHPGILRGGSSVMNTFDGDAASSMFTLGAWNRKRFFESVRGVGFLVLFLLNPFRTLKTLILAIWEYLTDLTQRSMALIKHQTPRPLERAFPFLRVMCNVIMREIQTFAVMVDIYRGVPAIYTTYYGYDELAHHFGPCSAMALRALRAIDVRIRQIDALRRLALTREYDLYILSDHGQTAARPFSEVCGQSLGSAISSLIGGEISVDENGTIEPAGASHELYLAEELAVIEANVGRPWARIPRYIRRRVTEHYLGRLVQDQGPLAQPPSRPTGLIVRSSGSLAHIYLDIKPSPLSLGEIVTYYPSLINGLVAHAGIWLVIGREKEQVVVMSKEGVLILDDGCYVEGCNPLQGLPAPGAAAAQLRRLARFPHAGDLILMGRYDPQMQMVVCFERHWGCHGGLGGPQETAFMILHQDIGWDLSTIVQATQIYPLFVRRYEIH